MSVLKKWNGSAWVPLVVGATGPQGPSSSVSSAAVVAAITSSPSAVKASLALVKADVGLGSVDNTADSAKPVSSAQAAAIAAAPFSSVGLAAGLAIALG